MAMRTPFLLFMGLLLHQDIHGDRKLGLGISWAGVFHAWFMDILRDAERGASFGFIRTVYMFLGASGSVVTGTLADASGWPARVVPFATE